MSLLPQNPVSHDKSAIVFLVHGTRNPEAGVVIHQSLKVLCQQFSDMVHLPQEAVVYGFLEIMQPSLTDVLFSLCRDGKTEIRILPLLLFPGSHLNQDIPEITREVMAQFPGVRINTGGAIGVHDPEFMQILLKRL